MPVNIEEMFGGGGGAGTVTNTGALTAGKLVLGNGGVDVTASAIAIPAAATAGDILSASGANTYANITAVATGQVLISGGVATLPAWSATPTVTGLTTATITTTQGTIAADAPQINGTVTWNNAGILGPAWKLVVTDTSSNSTALLIDLLVSASSKFKVDKSGHVTTVTVRALNSSIDNNPTVVGIVTRDTSGYSWTNGSNPDGTGDLFLRRAAAATLQLGLADVNGSAVAQTLRVQSAITGTDQAAANFTIQGSRQTGAGTTGQIIFQTSPKLASGTTQGTLVTALTLTAPAVNMNPSVVVGNQALVTTATDGFLYIPTCAGTPTGVPTAFTGRVALVYDTTNFQFWIYDGAWKQPKTPAGAAIVTWQ